MSSIDIVLGIIILIGAYSGYKDGFIVSLFSLFAIMLGILGGFKLMGTIMVFLSSKYNVDEKVLPYLSFAVVFVIIVIFVNLLGKLIKASLGKSILGQLDQGVGALLGLVRVTFMLSTMLWIADSLTLDFPKHWTTNSWLYPTTANFAPKVTTWISEFLPMFGDVF